MAEKSSKKKSSKKEKSEEDNTDEEVAEKSSKKEPKESNNEEKGSKAEKRKNIEVKEDEVLIDLNSKKKVSIRKFKNNTLIDIREYFDKYGESLPTKKGISLTVDVWNKLKSHISDIDEAIENL